MAKKNSYQEVLNEINKEKGIELTICDLFRVSLGKVIRIEDETKVDELWDVLKKDVKTENVENNRNSPHKVYVRGNGRNGSGNRKLKDVLSVVFNRDFQIDGSNNSRPQSILRNEIDGEYEDYQVSHLFERRTNNPFLFGAPWMICYVPKILDPFTGHETKGFPELTKYFVWWAFKKNEKYIKDYNETIIPYWKKLKNIIPEGILEFSKDKKEKAAQEKKNHMICCLAPLILSYEQETNHTDREKKYLELYNMDVNSWENFVKNEQFKEKEPIQNIIGEILIP